MTSLDGVFRRKWGPAVARWCGDLTIAADAVQEACAEALRTWPHDGIPERPGALIITVARNRAIDRLHCESLRHGKKFEAVLGNIGEVMVRTERSEPNPVPDDELRMMFTCARPALDPTSQLTLTLRLVSGLTVPGMPEPYCRAKLRSGSELPGPRTRFATPTSHCECRRSSCCQNGRRMSSRACTRCYRGLLVHAWPVRHPRRALRRRSPAGRRVVRSDADRIGRPGSGCPCPTPGFRRATRVDGAGALVPLDEQDRSRWDRARMSRRLDRLLLAAGSPGICLLSR
jgi:RNA polymerase sigma-70 factor (ECF subfamily)